MQCYFCGAQVPAEAISANFCVDCGKPITQQCPYELDGARSAAERSQVARLPLCDSTGRATASCISCDGLFKACSVCRRLHKLEASRCVTEGCPGILREPIEAFPCPEGALDGTRAIRWAGYIGTPPKLVGSPQTCEPLRQLVFRYGRLYGVSRTHIYSWVRRDSAWDSAGARSLVNGGGLETSSLMVDQGRAFVLAPDRAVVFDLLGGLTQTATPEECEPCTLQTVGNGCWIRITRSGSVLVTDTRTMATVQYQIPPQVGTALAVMMAGALFISTSTSIVRMDVSNGAFSIYPLQNRQWRRISALNGKLIAMGADQSSTVERLTLAIADLDGRSVMHQRELPAGTQGQFACVDGRLYVVRVEPQTATYLETYDLAQPTLNPKSINVTSGMQIVPRMFALAGTGNARDKLRVVLLTADGTHVQFMMYDPGQGKHEQVGPYLDRPNASDGWEQPLICFADSNIVLASLEQGQSRLRTYFIEEPR